MAKQIIDMKDNITRASVKDQNMKVVIVRLDYSGVNDLNEVIKLFDKKFPKAFKSKRAVENREINLNFREVDFQTISDSLSIPINAIKRERFIRYEGINNCNCDVTLDMSQFYLCLTIKCNNNYDGITEYIAPLKGAIKIFKDKIPYFSPKRLGIRKVRVESNQNISYFSSIFEPFVFPKLMFNIGQDSLMKSEYLDAITDISTGLRSNIKREISVTKDKNDSPMYRTTLDIDTYYHEDALEKGNINNLLNFANEKEFILYKQCMTQTYLSSISRH